MAVGEVGQVEHLSASVLAFDCQAAALGVDRDDVGGVAVQPIGTVAVASDLHAVARLRFLLGLGERLGVRAAPAVGLPIVRLALVADKPSRSGFGVDAFYGSHFPEGGRPFFPCEV